MQLYENKKEISLYEALYKMKADNVPGHDYEFMISFDEVFRLTSFGTVFGMEKYFWIETSHSKVKLFEDEDEFLIWLLRDDQINGRYDVGKKFHVWEEVK